MRDLINSHRAFDELMFRTKEIDAALLSRLDEDWRADAAYIKDYDVRLRPKERHNKPRRMRHKEWKIVSDQNWKAVRAHDDYVRKYRRSRIFPGPVKRHPLIEIEVTFEDSYESMMVGDSYWRRPRPLLHHVAASRENATSPP
jgi:hypothetical protein